MAPTPSPTDPYPDIEAMTAYFASGLRALTWEELGAETQAAARFEAVREFEMLAWNGYRCEEDQDWAWPRHGVCCNGMAATCDGELPLQVQTAFCELALALGSNASAIYSVIPADGRIVTRERLDVLEQEYSVLGNTSGPSAIGAGYPTLIQRFPWLKDLLGCWASVGPQRHIRVFRN